MVHGRVDELAVQTGQPGEGCPAVCAPLQGGDHATQRSPGRRRRRDGGLVREGHPINLPTWNTTTASDQATASCTATPNIAHLVPTSRRWAARVATHGV